MVYVPDEFAQVVDAKIFHVDSVYEHLSFLHIIVAGDEVEQGGFPTSALSHQSHGLSFWNDEVDVFQHPLLFVLERNVAKFYLMLEVCNLYRLFCLFDIDLRV